MLLDQLEFQDPTRHSADARDIVEVACPLFTVHSELLEALGDQWLLVQPRRLGEAPRRGGRRADDGSEGWRGPRHGNTSLLRYGSVAGDRCCAAVGFLD